MSLTDPGVALYVSAAVAVVVWLGIFIYLWRLDVQARDLRRILKDRQPVERPASAAVRPERQAAADRRTDDHKETNDVEL